MVPRAAGKSSLLQAGLLPSTGKDVEPVCEIEATAEDTMGPGAQGLQEGCPDLTTDYDDRKCVGGTAAGGW